MGKMILITTDNEVKELEYPDVGLKSWKKLKEHIGNRCELIEPRDYIQRSVQELRSKMFRDQK